MSINLPERRSEDPRLARIEQKLDDRLKEHDGEIAKLDKRLTPLENTARLIEWPIRIAGLITLGLTAAVGAAVWDFIKKHWN